MTTSKKNLGKALSAIKKDYEHAITKGWDITKKNGKQKHVKAGSKAVISLIRSKKLINYLHEYVKAKLIEKGIDKCKIFPTVDQSKGEIELYGYLKSKKQDILVLPELPKLRKKRKTGESQFLEYKINNGVLKGDVEKFKFSSIQKSLSVNVRSQLSKTAGNFSTLMERHFAESLNLHMRFKKLVMGEIYLLPLVGYDYKKTEKKKIAWNEDFAIKIIPLFRELNNRTRTNRDFYKYERNCLLLVDFRKKTPKIISTADELKKLGFIDDKKKYSMKGLGIDSFFDDIIKIYKKRHGKTGIFK